MTLDVSFQERIAYGVLLSTMMIFGLLGNFLIIKTICSNERKLSDILILNLAACDIMVCLSMSVSVATVMKGENILAESTCIVLAYVYTVLECTQIQLFCIICINRYVIISGRNTIMARLLKIPSQPILVMSAWLMPIIILTGPFFGWGKIAYNPSFLECSYHASSSYSYVIFTITVGFLVQSYLIGYCNMKTFIILYRASRIVSPEIKNTDNSRELKLEDVIETVVDATAASSRNMDDYRVQTRVVVMMFVAIVYFYVSYVPLIVMQIFSDMNTISYRLVTLLRMLMFSSHCTDVVIYVVCNKKFYQNLKRSFSMHKSDATN